jgi:hypothetical protein
MYFIYFLVRTLTSAVPTVVSRIATTYCTLTFCRPTGPIFSCVYSRGLSAGKPLLKPRQLPFSLPPEELSSLPEFTQNFNQRNHQYHNRQILPKTPTHIHLPNHWRKSPPQDSNVLYTIFTPSSTTIRATRAKPTP